MKNKIFAYAIKAFALLFPIFYAAYWYGIPNFPQTSYMDNILFIYEIFLWFSVFALAILAGVMAHMAGNMEEHLSKKTIEEVLIQRDAWKKATSNKSYYLSFYYNVLFIIFLAVIGDFSLAIVYVFMRISVSFIRSIYKTLIEETDAYIIKSK